MRKLTIAMIAVTSLLAFPALAQSSNSGMASSNPSSSNTPQNVQQMVQTLRQDLSKAGTRTSRSHPARSWFTLRTARVSRRK